MLVLSRDLLCAFCHLQKAAHPLEPVILYIHFAPFIARKGLMDPVAVSLLYYY